MTMLVGMQTLPVCSQTIRVLSASLTYPQSEQTEGLPCTPLLLLPTDWQEHCQCLCGAGVVGLWACGLVGWLGCHLPSGRVVPMVIRPSCPASHI